MISISELYNIYLKCGGNVTTDSRAIKGGELFIALKGENFDGNAYALQAIEKGASYALVNEDSEAAVSGNPAVCSVPDTFIALKQLANHHRNQLQVNGKRLPVIGLTGTNGKTTTKELLRRVLATTYNVSATEGNLNNDIGVPLTLLKIRPGTELAVVEMGANHPDDILHLVEVCEPDFGLITNVGKAHLLGFGSFEGVCRAKGQLYDWLQAHDGQAFVNADQPVLLDMVTARNGLKAISYGVEYDKAVVIDPDAEHPYLRMCVDGKSLETNLVGSYNAMNVMAAVAVGKHFNVPVEAALEAIASFEPANKRSQMVRTASNTLIVDAYNANPSSMAVAIDNFAAMNAAKKLALLGDMRELGEDSLKEHVAIVKKLESAGIDTIFVGEEFKKALAMCPDSPRKGWCASSENLASYLENNPVRDTVVLIKGSRGIMMEKTIPQL